jgi:hypothetical protein
MNFKPSEPCDARLFLWTAELAEHVEAAIQEVGNRTTCLKLSTYRTVKPAPLRRIPGSGLDIRAGIWDALRER